ncbi:hypothetical protein JR316_0004934 [Psilocybe cubensis]|uniref:Uncharacterized protein n=1 Tax=Psilocybe cubensis TaxID=181762 RepID=A0ACB8H534_PSICU|nr:hypothetical protein JR316_0004934 [Psilocybe cubensis]KAH9482834.1 hypothetical protein JR316_0004934 [Psilocybe cubensis]
MPRILPRLLKKIESQAHKQKFFKFSLPRKRIRKSLYKPPLQAPSFQPSHHARSILLTPLNPITNAKDYVKHKRIPPSLNKPGKVDPNDVDPARQMSKDEMRWWANPYHMLIRLTGMRIPSSNPHRDKRNQAKLVPDGILHPKYTNRKVSGGMYTLCWRQAIRQLERGAYKRISAELSLYSSLEHQIAHLLRLRILQEFELLAECLEFSVKRHKNLGATPILRRLTYDEWGLMRSTGSLPCQNALAILICPPLNRNWRTGERPKGSFSALPPADEHALTNLPPTSTLISASEDVSLEEVSDTLPQLQVPLYNCISAFPSVSQRAALHTLLLRILTTERFVKTFNKNNRNSHLIKPSRKHSPAFLLCADENTIHRGDSAAVALALWRLRMYDSEGWQSPQHNTT